MLIVPWDPFLMKKLLKVKFVRPMNSAPVHCSLLKSQSMRLGKKKKKEERNANVDPRLESIDQEWGS